MAWRRTISKVTNIKLNIAGKNLKLSLVRATVLSFYRLHFIEVFEEVRTLRDGNVSIKVSPVQVLGHHEH